MTVPKPTEVAIASQSASIKLYWKDMGPDGSVQVSVRLVGYGFSGRHPNVWISREDFRSFLIDLRSLERSRRGEARLASMSPDELSLHLRITDPAGHVRVDAAISRIHYGSDFEPASVRLGFAFDPSRLPAILTSFERLADHGKEPVSSED
jgi:hypothetical protein